MSNDREKLSKIEDIKSRLFSRNYKTEIEHRNVFHNEDVRKIPDSWAKESSSDFFGKKFLMKSSFFKKFFFFSIAFFVLAIIYASYTFFMGGNTVSNSNIDISILGNTFTSGGEELPLQINITNKNSLSLDLVDLVIEYPKSAAMENKQDIERYRQSLGSIPSGAVRSENVKLVLFGEQGSSRQIKISIEYRVEGSNAIFIKDKFYDVNISSTPIDLSIDSPTEISPNQDVVLNLKTTLNGTKTAPNMLLRLDYPAGFQFVSAKPAPSFGNNAWSLGDLAPGIERSITVVGKMIDVFDGEQKTFRLWAGEQSKADKSLIGIIFNSIDHTLIIKRAFIEAKLFINGVYQREYASDTKTPISGQIRWTNNLDTKINDLEIRAKITGNVINEKNISTESGLYNSIEDTIIWDKNSLSDFKEVNPGESGTVSFSIMPSSLFASSGGLIIDPSLNIDISIAGKQAADGGSMNVIKNGESKIVRIISDVGFANKILYYSGPFPNTGPIPPKAEQETTYTVIWNVTNTSNNISKAKITSTLPPWVRFAGTVAPGSEDLNYNSATKEIVWNIGNLRRGTGITEMEKEVAFQIILLPSMSQVGSTPILINDAVLTGHDDFANVSVRVNKYSLNTQLANDGSLPPGGGRVAE